MTLYMILRELVWIVAALALLSQATYVFDDPRPMSLWRWLGGSFLLVCAGQAAFQVYLDVSGASPW